MKIKNLKVRFKKLDVPFVSWVVVICTFIAAAGDFPFLGRQISGWAWVVPLVISILILLRKTSRITFPVYIWLPWIIMVSIYLIISGFSYVQRNVLLLCPILIGMAVSTTRIRETQVKDFLALMWLLVCLIFGAIVIKTGLLFSGVLPSRTGFAPQSMTTALLCTVFAAGYSANREKDLYRWMIGTAVPIIALTRTAIAVTGLTIPFTFATLRIRKRLIFLLIVAMLSLALFYTERVQKKMFFSGAGTLHDMRTSNPDFFTGGRSRLWDLMFEEIEIKPFWGHGPNASEEFVLSVTWGTLTHPHNDWLRLLYDYGVIGTSIFAFCLVAQVIHLLRKVKGVLGESRILFYAGASSFLPFVLLMFTDNIILYAAFFGNLQFTLLGLAYSAYKTAQTDLAYMRYYTFFAHQAEPTLPTKMKT